MLNCDKFTVTCAATARGSSKVTNAECVGVGALRNGGTRLGANRRRSRRRRVSFFDPSPAANLVGVTEEGYLVRTRRLFLFIALSHQLSGG